MIRTELLAVLLVLLGVAGSMAITSDHAQAQPLPEIQRHGLEQLPPLSSRTGGDCATLVLSDRSVDATIQGNPHWTPCSGHKLFSCKALQLWVYCALRRLNWHGFHS